MVFTHSQLKTQIPWRGIDSAVLGIYETSHVNVAIFFLNYQSNELTRGILAYLPVRTSLMRDISRQSISCNKKKYTNDVKNKSIRMHPLLHILDKLLKCHSVFVVITTETKITTTLQRLLVCKNSKFLL